jgi:hypothetical protein
MSNEVQIISQSSSNVANMATMKSSCEHHIVSKGCQSSPESSSSQTQTLPLYTDPGKIRHVRSYDPEKLGDGSRILFSLLCSGVSVLVDNERNAHSVLRKSHNNQIKQQKAKKKKSKQKPKKQKKKQKKETRQKKRESRKYDEEASVENGNREPYVIQRKHSPHTSGKQAKAKDKDSGTERRSGTTPVRLLAAFRRSIPRLRSFERHQEEVREHADGHVVH